MYLLTPTTAIEAKAVFDETSIAHSSSENLYLSIPDATVFITHVRNETNQLSHMNVSSTY